MRKNILVLGVSLAAVVAVTFFAAEQNTEQTYVPRAESDVSQGIKGAQEFYNMAKADMETGLVDFDLMQRRREEATAHIQNSVRTRAAMNWENIGPNNVGGRTRSVISYDENVNIMFAGSVAGGLWKTTDGGQNWSMVNSFSENLMIGDITRLGNGWIVVGTGNSFEPSGGFGNTGFRGDGLFISKDDGVTFSLVTDDSGNDINYENGWRVFNTIVADPNESNVAWTACTKGIKKINFQTGVFTTPSGASGTVCNDITISSSGNIILASYSSNVALSRDGGNTFTFIGASGAGNLKKPTGRCALAISPDDEAYMYAVMEKSNGAFDGVYYSADTGNTWQTTWASGGTDYLFGSNAQGDYDMAISVVPGKPQVVVVAGVTLWVTGPGAITEQIALNFTAPNSPLYVHSDIHHLSWANNSTLIVGCDGGVHIGDYNGQSFAFKRRNYQYNVTQFYNIGIDGTGQIIGGTQDNGTHYVSGLSSNATGSVEVLGGDGFTCELSVLMNNGAIASIYRGAFTRSSNVGVNGFGGFVSDVQAGEFGGFFTTGALFEERSSAKARRVEYTYVNNLSGRKLVVGDTISVNSQVLTGEMVRRPIETELEIDSSISFYDETNVMYAVDQGNSIHLTRDIWDFDGTPDFWKIADNQSNVSQMAFSKSGNHLFLAKLGGLTRISNLNDAWFAEQADIDSAGYLLEVKNITGVGLGLLSDVAVEHYNDDHVVVVRYGYSSGGSPQSHVYESLNATSDDPTFASIQGDLPDFPVYAVEIDMSDPSIIYIGTEEGMYVTEDGGVTWVNQTVNGMDRTPVYDIKIQTRSWEGIINTGVVYVGTHGRGFYKMENRLLQTYIAEEEKVTINKDLLIYPNPITNDGTIAFELNEDNGATLNIMNLTGQVVKTIDATNLSVDRENKVTFNVLDLPVGTYLMHLNNGADQRSGRFVKTK